MAKIYTFNVYSSDDEQGRNEYFEYQEYDIRISNSFREHSKFLIKEFEDDKNIAIANEVDPRGGRGGGGACDVFPLAGDLAVSLIIYITLKKPLDGFLEELGATLARKLLKNLFDKDKSTKLVISNEDQYLEIIIPPSTNITNLVHVQDYLNQFDKHGRGQIIFDEKSKNFIYLEQPN